MLWYVFAKWMKMMRWWVSVNGVVRCGEREMTCLFCSLIRRILIFSYANNHIYSNRTLHIYSSVCTHCEYNPPVSLTPSPESSLIHSALPFLEFQYYWNWNFLLFSIHIERCENFPAAVLAQGGSRIIEISFFLSPRLKKMATLRVEKIITEL